MTNSGNVSKIDLIEFPDSWRVRHQEENGNNGNLPGLGLTTRRMELLFLEVD